MGALPIAGLTTAEQQSKRPQRVLRADGTEVQLTPRQADLVNLVLDDEETVSPAKAAELLGVSRPMVVRWINQGILQDQKTGTHHKIPLTSVWELKFSRIEAGRAAVAAVAAVRDAPNDDAAARRTAAARDRARARIARRDRAS